MGQPKWVEVILTLTYRDRGGFINNNELIVCVNNLDRTIGHTHFMPERYVLHSSQSLRARKMSANEITNILIK